MAPIICYIFASTPLLLVEMFCKFLFWLADLFLIHHFSLLHSSNETAVDSIFCLNIDMKVRPMRDDRPVKETSEVKVCTHPT